MIICGLTLLACAGISFWSSMSPDGLEFWMGAMGENKVLPHPVLSVDYIKHAGTTTLIWSLALLALLVAGWLAVSKRKHSLGLIYVFLVLAAVNGLVFRFERDIANLSFIANGASLVMPPVGMPFNIRRYRSIFEGNSILMQGVNKEALWDRRFRDGSENLFWRHEEVASTFMLFNWLDSFDGVLRIFEDEPFGSLLPPAGFNCYSGLNPPIDPLFMAIAGATQDKIRLYDSACPHPIGEIARAIRMSSGSASQLILLDDGSFGTLSQQNLDGVPSQSSNEVRCTGFSANRATFVAEISNPEGSWLFYSDAWHPNWSALVNGNPVPIKRAFYGYKAVRVPSGVSTVDFRFDLPLYQPIHMALRLFGALCATLVLLALGFALARGGEAWNLVDRHLNAPIS